MFLLVIVGQATLLVAAPQAPFGFMGPVLHEPRNHSLLPVVEKPRLTTLKTEHENINLPIQFYEASFYENTGLEKILYSKLLNVQRPTTCKYKQKLYREYKIWTGSQSPYCLVSYQYTEWLWQHKDQMSLCLHEMSKINCKLYSFEKGVSSEYVIEDTKFLHCYGYKLKQHWKSLYITEDLDVYGPIIFYKEEHKVYRVAPWAIGELLILQDGGKVYNYRMNTTNIEVLLPSTKYVISVSTKLEELYLSVCLKNRVEIYRTSLVKFNLSQPGISAWYRGLEQFPNKDRRVSFEQWYSLFHIMSPPSITYGEIRPHNKGSIPHYTRPGAESTVMLNVPCTRCRPNTLKPSDTKPLNNYNIKITTYLSGKACTLQNWILICKNVTDFHIYHHHEYELDEDRTSSVISILEDVWIWLYHKITEPFIKIFLGPDWQTLVFKIFITNVITFWITGGNLVASALLSIVISFYLQ